MVPDSRIAQAVNEHFEKLNVAAEVLIKTANVAGGDDNITVALVRYTE
jgi:serine/threonine protein phosphatase PrpC